MELAKLLQERLGICLNAEAAQIVLNQYPWLTSKSALEQHTEEVLAFLLASDFNQAGAACLPADLATWHNRRLDGRYVLQVDETANIAAAIRDRYKEVGNGRCLKLLMTDGVQHVAGIEDSLVGSLQCLAPAGFKVAVSNAEVRHGMLMLRSENTLVLGGQVEVLERARQAMLEEWRKPPSGQRRDGGAEGRPTFFEELSRQAWATPGGSGDVRVDTSAPTGAGPQQRQQPGARPQSSGRALQAGGGAGPRAGSTAPQGPGLVQLGTHPAASTHQPLAQHTRAHSASFQRDAEIQEPSSAPGQAAAMQQHRREVGPQQRSGPAAHHGRFFASGAGGAATWVDAAASAAPDVIQISSESDEGAAHASLEDSLDGDCHQGRRKRPCLGTAADGRSRVQPPLGGTRPVVIDTEFGSDEDQNPGLRECGPGVSVGTTSAATHGICSAKQPQREPCGVDSQDNDQRGAGPRDTEVPESPASAAGGGDWPDEPQGVEQGARDSGPRTAVADGSASPAEELRTMMLADLAQRAGAADRGSVPLLARVLYGSVKTLRGPMKFRNELDNTPLERYVAEITIQDESYVCNASLHHSVIQYMLGGASPSDLVSLLESGPTGRERVRALFMPISAFLQQYRGVMDLRVDDAPPVVTALDSQALLVRSTSTSN